MESEEGTQTVFAIGPESELTVVGPIGIASEARIVPSNVVEDAGFEAIGDTELRVYELSDYEGETRYVILTQELWQPVIEESDLNIYGFVTDNDRLGERRIEEVNGFDMELAPYTRDDGNTIDVVILTRGTTRTMVIPSTRVATLQLAQAGGLSDSRGATMDRIPFRIQDGYRVDDRITSGSFGW